jgi:hypothetical protein
VVHELFERARTRRLPIRLLGIALGKLGSYDEQLPLFGDDQRLHRAVDGIRRRYGYDALRIALGVSELSERRAATPPDAPRRKARG